MRIFHALLFALTVTVLSAADTPVFNRTIYLVRHGNYTSSKDLAADDGFLNPLGLAQARLVAARLRGLPIVFTSLTASTMPRARQTAEVIHELFPDVPLQTTPLLRECTPRTWRPNAIKSDKPADLDAAEAQLNAAFVKYFVPAQGRDENDIIVCHGNVIRYLVMKALHVDTQAWLGFSIAHCSLTVVRVSPDGSFKIFAVGDIGHIPPNLQSGATKADPQLVAPRT